MARKPSSGSPTNIEVDKTTLGRLLKSRRLVVPGFQREYSWKQERVQKLFNDFRAAMSRRQESYFLGTIVLQTTDPLSLIDGQQRLATTSIFLAAVRDAFLNLGAADEAKSITSDFLFTYDRNEKEVFPRLLLNIDDREYIKTAVLLEPNQRTPPPVRHEVHSHRLIDQAFACCCAWVEKIMALADTPARQVEELNVWVDFIEQKAVVVALTPPNLSQAYQMFITLNDRAQRTTQADLIKSHLFQEASESETDSVHIPEASAKWATARKMADIGGKSQDDPILNYLRYLCVIRTGPVTLDGLFDVIEGNIAGKNQALAFLDELSRYSKPYRAAIGDHPVFWNDKGPELNTCVVHCVKNMGVNFPIPLFLAIGIKFGDREAKLALRAIESWCARLVITAAQRTGTAERGFGQLAHRIYKGDITAAEDLIREAEVSLVPSDSTFKEKFLVKTLSNERQARFFLKELEAQVRADGGDAFAAAVDNPEEFDLEHILPKSKDWAANYPAFTLDERNAAISKIGNLALLKRDANGALNDAPFSRKMPVLSRSSLKTTEVAAGLAVNGDWTPGAIDARQAWLSDLAMKRWPLFSGKTHKGRARQRR